MQKNNQEEYAFKPSNKEEYDWLMEYLEENTDYKWNYDGVSLKPTKFKGDKDFIASDFIIIEKDEIWKTSYPKSGSTLVIVTDLIQGKFDINLENEETEVKKDIEWLKEEIGELPCVDTVFNSDGSYYIDSAVPVMTVYDLLNQLDEPEVLTLEWIDEHEIHYNHWVGAVPVTELRNLLVPKQEKPVIPNYVAKWISVHRERFELYPALKRLENNALSWEGVYDWYRKNTRKFVNAYLTGKYEVEEEQKYYVVDNEYIPLLQKGHGYVNRTSTGLSIFEKGRDNDQFALIEQEIKDYDERYWPFAVRVEELEE